MNENSKIIRSFSLISQFGIHMLVPIFMCSYVGYLIDSKLQTKFVFILCFFIGAIAGGRNVFLLAKKIYDDGTTSPSVLYESKKKKTKKENPRKWK